MGGGGIPGQLCACPLSSLLRTVLTDRALVRETGTKFIVGVWGSQFPSCTVGTQSRGGALEAKTGFVALLASAQHHLPPIKLSNYRRVVPPPLSGKGRNPSRNGPISKCFFFPPLRKMWCCGGGVGEIRKPNKFTQTNRQTDESWRRKCLPLHHVQGSKTRMFLSTHFCGFDHHCQIYNYVF